MSFIAAFIVVTRFAVSAEDKSTVIPLIDTSVKVALVGVTRSTSILTTVFAEAVTPAFALLIAVALSAAELDADSPINLPLIVILSEAAIALEVTTVDVIVVPSTLLKPRNDKSVLSPLAAAP